MLSPSVEQLETPHVQLIVMVPVEAPDPVSFVRLIVVDGVPGAGNGVGDVAPSSSPKCSPVSRLPHASNGTLVALNPASNPDCVSCTVT
jgi:hypothetical protein